MKGDHAPDCGVAQGVIHGVVGHHGKKEEEVEEELGREVKGQEEENTQTPVRMTMTMDEMERHCEALEPMRQCEQDECNASKNGAQCAQCCAVNSSVCVVSFTQLVTVVSMLLRLCLRLCTMFRSLLYHKMFVNFRCRMY